jgi:outer membrane protein assembly factor BamB
MDTPAPDDTGNSNPTLLVSSRYGTLWLLDAATGAVRWRLVNGCHPGTLAHGGDMIFFTTSSTGIVRRDTRTAPLSRDEAIRYHHLLVRPAEVLALRAQDGAIVWRREGWLPRNQHHRPPDAQSLDGDVLLTDVTDFAEEATVVSALDARTGAVRWSRKSPTSEEGDGSHDASRFLSASAGRTYISQLKERRLYVLDSQTGELAWSCEQPGELLWLSRNGTHCASFGSIESGQELMLMVRRTVDGVVIGTLPHLLHNVRGLSDDGAVYITSGPSWQPGVDALRVSDGAQLWHADRQMSSYSLTMNPGISPGQHIFTANNLYFVHLTQQKSLAEALAFDAQSGRQRWRWHSPAHLPSLLKLWGGRTPQVIAFALSQGRRDLARYRGRTHAWGSAMREIAHGQWRRPASLLGGISVAVGRGGPSGEECLYIGTSMGLFALRARDGHLLWHALLMMEINDIVPQ